MTGLAAELSIPRWAVKVWWRTRERDSGIASPDIYGPSSPYGRVAGLDPPLAVISETGETPLVCCGYCAAHMACWTAEPDLSVSMFHEAHAMRAAAGRPHNAGSNASELRNGARSALGITLEACAVSEIRPQLAAGLAVAASVQFGDLPEYLKPTQGGDFGHGVTLYGYRQADDLVGYFDPLWPGGVAGAWARWDDLVPALWSDGNHSTTIERWGAKGADDMSIQAADGLTSDLRADVVQGLDFYGDANLTRREGSMSKATTVVFIGSPIGETATGGAYAIKVTTGAVYNDGSSRPSVVYVPATSIDPYRVPPPSTPDVAEAIEQNNLEWREWLLEGAPGNEETP